MGYFDFLPLLRGAWNATLPWHQLTCLEGAQFSLPFCILPAYTWGDSASPTDCWARENPWRPCPDSAVERAHDLVESEGLV